MDKLIGFIISSTLIGLGVYFLSENILASACLGLGIGYIYITIAMLLIGSLQVLAAIQKNN